ncbi:McrB family protein [Brevundimonas sp.]|uniref:McrB family protein n=1 Tax=Brevundimonas sp. TaxID=1871086 RepID=UPI0035629D33
MSQTLDTTALREAYAVFQNVYGDTRGQAWRQSYAERVASVQDAPADVWVTPAFQQSLWESSGISGIGPGSAVTVMGAYQDSDLAALLLKLRDEGLPDDPLAAAVAIQTAYDSILDRVRPKYTEKRPRARIARLLAALYPRHMTCLMDDRRTYQVLGLAGAGKAATSWVGQNPLIRARLREALEGLGGTDVDHAMFSWYLWETNFGTPEQGALEVVGMGRTPSDVPAFSLMPAALQRPSLVFVKDNMTVLLTMLRECEQGLSRLDVIDVIRTAAPNLNEGSASIVLSQAMGGLGLLQLSDGGYRPTSRGLEVLNAAVPVHALRGPLIGRVLGAGLLLRLMLKHPDGVLMQALASELQEQFPTWKTPRSGQELIQWLVATDLFSVETVGGSSLLRLTEDGEDYAAALPEDFDDRWKPQSVVTSASATDGGEELAAEVVTGPMLEPYTPADIVADGCFLPQVDIDAMLALLKHKKNLVLQGPPGTGKTWLARRLGYALAGAKDPDRVMAVQFQPSLSYEDFVRGWRPYAGEDGKGGLQLADGAFLECVTAALARPKEVFVLVIEEINRGNPAQILGELLTLLEADKRIPGEALRLAYPRKPDERVYIPPNLHVIGTMNLADRSLALVDLALRRRFAFRTLEPMLNDAWRSWCMAAGAPSGLVDTMAKRLGELNTTIAADNRLRSQFCVGHSFVTPPKAGVADWPGWFRAVVETEIAPLLDEYWYDDEPTAKSQKAKLVAPL